MVHPACLTTFLKEPGRGPPATQHFSGGWQKRNKNSESTLEVVGEFSTRPLLPPFPIGQNARAPMLLFLPSLKEQKLQAHSWSVWPHGSYLKQKEGGISRVCDWSALQWDLKIHHLCTLDKAKLLCQGQEIIYVNSCNVESQDSLKQLSFPLCLLTCSSIESAGINGRH